MLKLRYLKLAVLFVLISICPCFAAVNSSVQYEVETGGSDTNGGGFSALTVTADGSATSGNTSSPVFHSTSYTFVAGDVGAMLFLKSGTNSIPGWWPIASVSGGNATLNAAIGAATLYASNVSTLNTTVGIATTASPSSLSWSIDYSQKGSSNSTGSNISVTDGVTAGTTTITSATMNAQPSLKGNLIYVTGGTGSITAVRYEVTAVASTTSITVDRSTGLTAGTGVTINIGGAFQHISSAMDAAWKSGVGSAIADFAVVWVQKGSYSGATLSTSGYIGPSGGYQSRLVGYNAVRGDNPTIASGNCPIYATTGAASGGWLNALNGYSVWNMDFDGTGTTGASVGISNSGAIESVINCRAKNYSGGGMSLSSINAFNEAFNNTGVGITGQSYYSYSHKNTGAGFALGAQGGITVGDISANNGGAGFSIQYQCGVVGSISFGNTTDGIVTSNLESALLLNNILVANGGWGINANGGATPYSRGLMVDYNTYQHNTSGTITGGTPQGVHDVVIGGTASNTPFNQTEANNISETSPDWTLNNTAGSGALLRGTGAPGVMPGIFSTASYKDFGPFQHQDSGTGVIPSVNISINNGSINNAQLN